MYAGQKISKWVTTKTNSSLRKRSKPLHHRCLVLIPSVMTSVNGCVICNQKKKSLCTSMWMDAYWKTDLVSLETNENDKSRSENYHHNKQKDRWDCQNKVLTSVALDIPIIVVNLRRICKYRLNHSSKGCMGNTRVQ